MHIYIYMGSGWGTYQTNLFFVVGSFIPDRICDTMHNHDKVDPQEKSHIYILIENLSSKFYVFHVVVVR
jgi:hypothetical protein